ncbi:RNA polymerase sigma factor [Novosphingobium profundi]|uniref:RNA polymerase sigma factor n=1 Tax=Novosphingobium profundi TaxID=1774954 RepID=UPI001BD9A5D1|nr:RNA polymerase sigma factor [Novosphingobium profundi]MBT0669287.1 RNA polymerase sigma factor [Novosphingobium profundi]
MSWLRDIDRWFLSEVLPHASAYRARAARFCGRDEADDLVQEAYARVLDSNDFRSIQSPRGFVLTIVRNLALERLRRANVVRIDYLASLEVLDLVDPSPDAFTVSSDRSELRQLLLLIEQLPPQCGRVLHMRKIQGMSPVQIAEALSISLSTVEKHIAKGLALVTRARRDDSARPEVTCPKIPVPTRRAST